MGAEAEMICQSSALPTRELEGLTLSLLVQCGLFPIAAQSLWSPGRVASWPSCFSEVALAGPFQPLLEVNRTQILLAALPQVLPAPSS